MHLISVHLRGVRLIGVHLIEFTCRSYLPRVTPDLLLRPILFETVALEDRIHEARSWRGVGGVRGLRTREN
jgi:hypothetical protein